MTLFGTPADGGDRGTGQSDLRRELRRCHGENGQGNRQFGGAAAGLAVHLYGDTARHGRRSSTIRAWA